VSNAADFATPGSTIRIALEPCEIPARGAGRRTGRAGWRLTVFNVGQPLPGAMVGSLFDSMVSVRESRGSASHLGLGLYLVRLIADFHGGQVFARDEDGGVRVGFTVPAAA
jgi:signal transduction histidine kinase